MSLDLDKFIKSEEYNIDEMLEKISGFKQIGELIKRKSKIDRLNVTKRPFEQIVENNYLIVEESKKDKNYRCGIMCCKDYDEAIAIAKRKKPVLTFAGAYRLKKRRGYFYVVGEITQEMKDEAQAVIDEKEKEIERLEKELEEISQTKETSDNNE